MRLALVATSIPFAWAFGRSIIRWALYVYLTGWFAFILLFLVKKRPPKMPPIPHFLTSLYGKRYINKHIALFEKEFIDPAKP